MWQHVYTCKDGNALCDIADEVERLYGFGICQVSVSPSMDSLYVDMRYPRGDDAFAYARELVAAARESKAAYQSTIRR